MLLFVPIASATSSAVDIKKAELYKAPENSSIENDLLAELSAKAELYNENFDKVPSVLKRFVASEEIAGKIKLENGEMLYVTLLMRGGQIGEFYTYDTPDDPNSKMGPTITIETDEKTVRQILDSDKPRAATSVATKIGQLLLEKRNNTCSRSRCSKSPCKVNTSKPLLSKNSVNSLQSALVLQKMTVDSGR